MILLIDSGSTNTHFVLLDKEGNYEEYSCKGFNPYYYNKNEFYDLLRNELYFKVKGKGIRQVFYYGSGCSSDSNCELVESTLTRFFPSAEIQVEHDLFGAAMALFGHKRGIACILGTGSNSCLWDGERIIENVPSLGYVLGDEGSGTYLGKIILTAILSNEADPKIARAFYREYNLSFSSTLERIYHDPYPNLFFSGLSEFVKKHIDHPWCQQMVKQNFTDFVDKQVSKYSTYQTSPVSFIGSVAFHFQDLLEEVLDANNITFGKVMKNPMDGLINYHLNT
ncbi:MAG: hypothetical protein C0591_12980 [Marinilabiliales bacterium]|nr:MAG: hypothetical protein C0591_12980 [Marinilabiliales bacterium]